MERRIYDKSGWHFTQVDNFILDNKELDVYEKMMYIMLKRFANHETLSTFVGIKTLSEHTGISERKTRYVIAALEQKGLIHIERRQQDTSIYTILPLYTRISSLNERKDTATAFNSAPNTNTAEKEKKADTLPYSEIVDYLNSSAGTSYRATSAKTRALIKARCKEGFALDDFKKVIDNKCATWLGTDMAKFLRPETLFGTKFESYLNEVAAQWQNKNRPPSGRQVLAVESQVYVPDPNFVPRSEEETKQMLIEAGLWEEE